MLLSGENVTTCVTAKHKVAQSFKAAWGGWWAWGRAKALRYMLFPSILCRCEAQSAVAIPVGLRRSASFPLTPIHRDCFAPLAKTGGLCRVCFVADISRKDRGPMPRLLRR